MKMKLLTLLLIGGALSFPVGMVVAADKDQTKDQLQTQDQDKMIYGWQLMTVQERNEFRQKMMSLKTEQERIAFREEHHKLMQQRAKEKGVTLPEKPMSHSMNPGGGGAGSGSGPGGGAGRGK